ncbi:MAG TPA: hypothetical protein VL096_14085 [Pirellulaceae bacterium]|nr:hypothetical protein [Pirellulaceae bacterium]
MSCWSDPRNRLAQFHWQRCAALGEEALNRIRNAFTNRAVAKFHTTKTHRCGARLLLGDDGLCDA